VNGIRVSQLAGGLLVVVMLAAPLATHLALVMQRGAVLAGILVAVQAAFVSWIASSSNLWRASRVCTCGLVFLGVLFLAQFAGGDLLVASAVPHAMAYLALLTIFATSLQPGREAIITMLARKARGPLPVAVVRYTRRVTWAWCGFFLAQLFTSLLLLLFARPEVWSLFINLFNLPLIGAMFCAEYTYRQWRHASRSPERLVDMLQNIRQIRTASISEHR
jgi:uncharacterized membrane protein